GAGRLESATRPGAANREGAGAAKGENSKGARRLQGVAGKGSVAPFRRQLPVRPGKVSKKAEVCARVRTLARRDHEAGAGRFDTDPERHLSDRRSALSEVFPEGDRYGAERSQKSR